jgi:ketosteroid isomerase-like protein
VSSDNVSTMARFFELIGRKETYAEGMAMVSDEFVGVEPAGLPYGGEYRGFGGMRDLLRAVNRFVTPMPKSVRLHDLGDRVLVEIEAVLRHVGTGATLDAKIMEFYSVADGKLTGLDVFYQDTKAVHDFVEAQAVLQA